MMCVFPSQGLKKARWDDLAYKGDWMQRPLSSSEIGWLVRLLVFLSKLINAKLRLDQAVPLEDAQAHHELDFQVLLTEVPFPM